MHGCFSRDHLLIHAYKDVWLSSYDVTSIFIILPMASLLLIDQRSFFFFCLAVYGKKKRKERKKESGREAISQLYRWIYLISYIKRYRATTNMTASSEEETNKQVNTQNIFRQTYDGQHTNWLFCPTKKLLAFTPTPATQAARFLYRQGVG